MDQSLLVQGNPVIPYQYLNTSFDEIYFQRLAQYICKDLLCISVQDSGKVGVGSVIRNICDIRQQYVSGTITLEFTL